MALASITADKIIKKLQEISFISKDIGKTCDVTQPRFCTTEQLSDRFTVTDHREDLFQLLANSSEGTKIVPGNNWNFNRQTLKIYNNLYWKGFYGRDANLMTTVLRYFGGFYKRFWLQDNKMVGVTHPFEPQVIDAKSIASEKEVLGYGKVIHLEYQNFPYSTAYDLLKMVDENTIIVPGKMPLDQFNALMQAQLPEEEFDTIGGFVLHLFGNLPAKDEEYKYNDFIFHVENVGKTRISRIKIKRVLE
jgi:hypothetical protein